MALRAVLLLTTTFAAEYQFLENQDSGNPLGDRIFPYDEANMRAACDAQAPCCGFTNRGQMKTSCGPPTPTPPLGGSSFFLKQKGPSYCNAGNTVNGDSNLGPVKLRGSLGTNITDLTDCPGQVGLIDLTALSASIIPGELYILNFDATTCDTGWQRLAYAYIDFNNNGVYDPSELLGQAQVDNRLTPFQVTFPFTPPCLDQGSVVGKTRMRVFVVESGVVPNPCLTFSYGGVKEFSIEIEDMTGPACGGTVAPTPFPTPVGYCKAGPTVVDSSNLGPVRLVGEITNINDGSNCPGQTGIRDLTWQSADVMPGKRYSMEFQVTTCNKAFPRYAYAFIDFNNNAVFETRELLGTLNVAAVTAPYNGKFTFDVPCLGNGSVASLTRLRVFVVEGGRTADPCLVYSYGAAKDFTVKILSTQAKPCSDGEIALVEPL